MGWKLLLLFVGVPMLELWLLIRVGEQVGMAATILLVVGTGVVGGFLARWQGAEVWRRIQSRLAEGALPDEEAVDGLIILLCGAFLVTPGILTDAVGLLGLIPPVRARLRAQLRKRLGRKIRAGQSAGGFSFRMSSFGTRGAAPAPPRPAGPGEASRGEDITRVVETFRAEKGV